jgi:formamidopyrimidine-DNA glycosylase
VPELPEVETVRRRLAPVMEGTRFTRVVLRREGLRRPFPPDFAARLTGRTLRSLGRRGKYLLGDLSSAETLLMHLGMTGSFRVEEAGGDGSADGDRDDGARPHDHVLFHLSSGAVVSFNDPRRFGVMDLVAPGQLTQHPALAAMGLEPLSPEFDAAALARAAAGKRTSLKVTLLDQHVVAGLGNIYASEALHRAGLSPRRRASTIATPSGKPKESAHRLATAIKQVLKDAIARKATAPYRSSRFRVYDRSGEACRTIGCSGTIRQIAQAGRSTFFCPLCQC